MSEWRFMETAPMDGTDILVATNAGRCYVVHWDEFYQWWYICRDTVLRPAQPTHWMPLPAPPAGPHAPGNGEVG